MCCSSVVDVAAVAVAAIICSNSMRRIEQLSGRPFWITITNHLSGIGGFSLRNTLCLIDVVDVFKTNSIENAYANK